MKNKLKKLLNIFEIEEKLEKIGEDEHYINSWSLFACRKTEATGIYKKVKYLEYKIEQLEKFLEIEYVDEKKEFKGYKKIKK